MNLSNSYGHLQAAEITVRVGKKTLLEKVDCELTPGKLDVIVGPNGAGKSTLLRAITGEQAIEEGTITLDGRPLEQIDNIELAKRRACLPQSSSLAFPFTIREVVSIGRHPHLEDPKVDRAITEAAVEKVGLVDRIDEGYLHLSGGEKQRVHLARVLAQLEKPEGRLLLLDEPTASLDLTYQQLVFDIAREWVSNGAAVLIVLHDLNQAMRYAQSVTLLQGGRLVCKGSPEAVLTEDIIEAVYEVQVRWVEASGHRLLAVNDKNQNK